LKIYEPAQTSSELEKDQATSPPAPKAKKLRGYGMLAGVLSVDDFLRRKHEETLREDQSISDRSRS